MNEQDLQAIGQVLSENKVSLIVFGVIFIIVVVVILEVGIKRMKKNSNKFKREINGYISDFSSHEYQYGGTVSLEHNGIRYSRGNKNIIFAIKIEKETVLAECLIDSWFENRNYNAREAERILNDIQHYLITNKFCKNVIILSDEEYNTLQTEKMYDTIEYDDE